ncbi:prostatic acid phosphatase isoform X1 [Octopus bimaculoides]|uniref:acid phosphatase n=2 Tax=Octopus bimaculoides TaxID=37653 RepID=A0A0L8I7U5_OCTBM|nr:prostatic acid phosphatase isoform X1 [Octopus bimaculoides]|eukprot:XP_014790422.1 PREDICTED: prostatic acid phosphatase-like [Octopus bimaculoides]
MVSSDVGSILTILAIISTICPASTEQTSSTLRLVHVLYRHGDRSPISDYPNDNLTNAWPKGLGQLTKVGMQQQYELGKYLRKRYDGFLNTSFNAEEILVRSTDKDRTLMSAYSNLAGFFYPSSQDIWNPDILWQPIPVHTVPRMDDNLLYMESNCPKYMKLYENFQKSKKFKELINDYKDVITLVSDKSGATGDIESVTSVYDNLFCKRAHNFSLPSWASDDIMLKLKALEIIKMKNYFYTPSMQLLKGGHLLWDIVENMNLKVTEPETLRKFIMYSAHDSTMIALFMSLNLFNDILPPYASCLIIELHKSEENSYFVQIFYKNSTSAEPVPLTMSGCEQKCLWNQFVRLTEESLTANIELECELPQDSLSSATLITVVFAIFFLIIVAIATMCFRHRKRESYKRIQV